jgi:dienelactone hydrolase
MAIVSVATSESHQKLMQAISDAVQAHTRQSPMMIDEIVGIIGFCAGAAIVSGCKSHNDRRKLRAVVNANVDNGMDAMTRAVVGSTSLIIPGVTQ